MIYGLFYKNDKKKRKEAKEKKVSTAMTVALIRFLFDKRNISLRNDMIRLLAFICLCSVAAAQNNKYNVLFIAVDDLRPDLDAYDDFCAFRGKLDRGGKTVNRREDAQASLDVRRKALHARMRRRRMRRRGRGERASQTKPFSLW